MGGAHEKGPVPPPLGPFPPGGSFTPPPPLVRSPGHHKDFIEACRDPIGRPACSNFDYAVGLTETVLLGVLAQRVGKKIEWDPAGMRAINCSEADAIIKPEYCKGWSL